MKRPAYVALLVVALAGIAGSQFNDRSRSSFTGGQMTDIQAAILQTLFDYGIIDASKAPTASPAGFGFAFGASSQAGAVAYMHVPIACTVSSWNVTVTTGTASVDVWKVAAGSALPDVSATITGSELPTVSSGNAARGTTLVGWTKAIAANDIVAFSLSTKSVSTALVSVVLGCRR